MTPTFSVCSEHGYIAGECAVCPECQRPAEVYSRVVGYLRPVNRWNDGKQQEYLMRREYEAGDSVLKKAEPDVEQAVS